MALRRTAYLLPKMCQVVKFTNINLRCNYPTNQQRVLYSSWFNWFSKAEAKEDMAQHVVYEDVKAATQNSSVYIIDVREPHEVKEGEIPNSLNIPLAEVSNVLGTLPDDQFEKKFGRSKPAHETPIIFSCLSGKRATSGADAAAKLGFTNTKIYDGSWRDWEKHIKN